MEGPLAESPAEEGGIRPGQRVVGIDDYPADLLSPLEIAALMRGPAGSTPPHIRLSLPGLLRGSPDDS